jgi:hypothetical protein
MFYHSKKHIAFLVPMLFTAVEECDARDDAIGTNSWDHNFPYTC